MNKATLPRKDKEDLSTEISPPPLLPGLLPATHTGVKCRLAYPEQDSVFLDFLTSKDKHQERASDSHPSYLKELTSLSPPPTRTNVIMPFIPD